MITLGKRGSVHARRQALSYLMTPESVDRLFGVVAPRYGDRNGGYAHALHAAELGRAMRPKWRTSS
jgi:large subunit ribosomal protein L17